MQYVKKAFVFKCDSLLRYSLLRDILKRAPQFRNPAAFRDWLADHPYVSKVALCSNQSQFQVK